MVVGLKETPSLFLYTIKIKWLTRERVGSLGFIFSLADAGEELKQYFASVFTKEKGMADSEISVGYINILGQFKIKKEVRLGLLKY